MHYPDLTPKYYSDLVDHIWRIASGSDGIVPYVDYDLEYPALSGMIVYVASIWGDVYRYYYTVGLIIYSFMIISVYVVFRILRLSGQSLHRISYYIIFTPSFLFFSMYSFDWIGVSLLLLSLYFASIRQPLLSGFFMGLSVAARIIPIVCLPFILREFSSWRKRILILLTASLAWLSLNLYFMVVDFEGFLFPYVFQIGWMVENSWLNLFPDVSKLVSAVLLSAALILILLWRKRRRFDLFEASFLALLAFVLTSFKFPPQYMVLLLPFFAVRLANRYYLLFITAEALNVMVSFWWFTPSLNLGNPVSITSPVQWLAITRQIVLLFIFISFFRIRYPIGKSTTTTTENTANTAADGDLG